MNTLRHKAAITILVVVPILGVLQAMVLLWNKNFFLTDLVLLLVFYSIAVLGITIGYHRMLTHKGFKAPEWLRGLFLIFGCMAFEGSPLVWTATHIKHHAHSDHEDDPHSPLHGFWHGHFGWLFDTNNFPDVREYAPHLLEDKTVMFVSKTKGIWMILALLIPYLIGGFTGLIWGGLVRVFLNTHVTWSVNSVCHTFGNKMFKTTDESRNHWIVGLLAYGEGWHNNHHAFPENAFHGMRWWQVDISGLIIHGMEKLGLIWDVQRVTPEAEIAHNTRADRIVDALKDMRKQVTEAIVLAQNEADMMLKEMKATLPKPEFKELKKMHKSAKARYDEMYFFVTEVALVKKHMLEEYLEEAQKTLSEFKTEVARRRGVA